MKKILYYAILLPLSLFLITFILANRQMTFLHLNPFLKDDATLTYQAPLFVWLLLMLSLGIIIGYLIEAIKTYRYKKKLKQANDTIFFLQKHLEEKETKPLL